STFLQSHIHTPTLHSFPTRRSSDLYAKKNWLPLRRTPVWIAFGQAISHFPELEKSVARARIEQELIDGFQRLYAELRRKFQLTRSEEHTSELQSRFDLVCRLLLEKK